MTGREAYRTLLLGKLHRDYTETYPAIRARALTNEFSRLLAEGHLVKQDVELIMNAQDYAISIRPGGHEGCELFDSIYDLLLCHERYECTFPFPRRTILWRGLASRQPDGKPRENNGDGESHSPTPFFHVPAVEPARNALDPDTT